MPDSGGAWQGGQVDDGIGQRAGGDTLALLLWGKLRFSQVVVPTPLFRVLKPLARRLARSTYNLYSFERVWLYGLYTALVLKA